MKCQILSSRKNKKTVRNLSSAALAQLVVKVKEQNIKFERLTESVCKTLWPQRELCASPYKMTKSKRDIIHKINAICFFKS